MTARKQLQATVHRISDPLLSFDLTWNVTYLNAAAAAGAGLPQPELVGQSIFTTHPEVARSPVLLAAQQAADTGTQQRFSAYSSALGKKLEGTAYPADDGVTVLLRDITAEHRAAIDLHATQERFAKIFEASPLPMLITRLSDGRYIDANPAFLQLTGSQTADLTLPQLYADPDDRAAVLHMIRERRPVLDHPVRYRTRSGAIGEASVSVVLVNVAGDICLVELIRDVNNERQAQQRLQASEQAARQLAAELQRTLDLSIDLIATFDAERRFVSVSAAAERLLGYRPEDLIGRPYFEYVHPDDRQRSDDVPPATVLTTFQNRYNRYIRRDGGVIWLEWTAARQPNGLTYAVARDITERRTATADQAFLAAIIHSSPNAIIGLTLDGKVRSWNRGAEQLYGYSAAEMLGHAITKIVPDELLVDEAHFLARAARGERLPSTETIRVSRTGHRIPVQLSLAPIIDSAGAVVGMSKITQDISDRREAERQVHLLNTTLQRKLSHLSGLREIDVSIASNLDLSVTLGVVLDQVLAQVGVDAATASLLDPHTLTLSFTATRGVTKAALLGTTVPLGQGVAGRVALTRQPEIVNELPTNPSSALGQALVNQEGFTSFAAVPMVAKGKVLGVLGVFRRQSFDASSDWLETLQTLAGQAAIAIDSAQLFLELQRTNLELGLAYQDTIEGWARALDLRDKETEGHSRRVTEMAVGLCRALGVRDAELVHIRRGALLHDIGKMGISDAILLKPGPLTAAEWVEMRRHPGYAVELLAPIKFLRPALEIPQHHHEKWDGSGYPQGLRGAAIPLAARAFAVVDVYDALTNDRPYRAAWTRERALAHLQEQAGSHFDPAVVQTFLALEGDAPTAS
ncbi:PAS domain S-box protein [Deinococcus ruber]|uniref:PAS domain S-box protein n=1 Tax=Deinococcus ruber TaxID=1848197 RepID=A0A918CFC0_9DEIO|nr:PAS domain S-box protein [Deinococcus ruber]GGR19421.1 hypothetical protein GCM10008957_34910 [Deinococcus ruber]